MIGSKEVYSSTTALAFALALGVHAAVADTILESFETGFGPWQAQGAIGPPDQQAWEWSVTRSQDQASDGTWSLDFTADGRHDDGTVWIERMLTLPAGAWDIGVQFDFWAEIDAQVGTWEKVAFIGTFDPEQQADFTVVGLEDFAGWTEFSHAETVVMTTPGIVWVAVGYRIAFETISRTHYFDAVTITGVPPQGQPIPAVSSWGTLVMVMLLLLIGTVACRSRRIAAKSKTPSWRLISASSRFRMLIIAWASMKKVPSRLLHMNSRS